MLALQIQGTVLYVWLKDTKDHDYWAPHDFGEICVYCHMPGSSGADIESPEWGRLDPGETGLKFTLYSGQAMDCASGQPSPISLACLCCHDGTVAINEIVSDRGSGPDRSKRYGTSPTARYRMMKTGGCHFDDSCSGCHMDEVPNIHDHSAVYHTIDLDNDHPVSMYYPDQPAAFYSASDGKVGVLPLFSGKVECLTCHNIHDPDIPKPFLRKSNAGSALCTSCHKK